MSLFRNLFARTRKPVADPRRQRRLFLESLEHRHLLAADIQVTKIGPDTVNAGDRVEYTIEFFNGGDADSSPVTFEDVFPANTTFVSCNMGVGVGTCDDVGGRAAGTLDPIAAGNTTTVQLTLQLARSAAPGLLINSATATTDPDDNPDNNTGTKETTIARRYDLVASSKTDTPDPIEPGQNITYTISILNGGPSDAPGAILQDTLPPDTTFVSLTPPTGWARTDSVGVGQTGTISATGPLPADGVAIFFTLVVRADDDAAGTITNTARVVADANESNAANNQVSTTTTVQLPQIVDLVVTKTDSPPTFVAPGNDITYTITLENTGGLAASQVTLTDQIPANTTFQSFTKTSGPDFVINAPAPGSTTGEVTATIASFPTGTATFQMVVRVIPTAAQNTVITNTASATTTSAEPDKTDNSDTETTTVVVQADLAVSKTDNPDPVRAGDILTYTVLVTTTGPSDALNAFFEDALPENTSLVSAVGPIEWTRDDALLPGATTGTIRFERATLPGNSGPSTFTIQVRVDADATGTISNTATVGSETTDPNDLNNTTPPITTTIEVAADLSVTKTDNRTNVAAGATNTYTVTVRNDGPSEAVNVTVTDTLPSNATYVQNSITQTSGTPAFTFDDDTTPGVITATAASMPPGSAATFTFVVTVNSGLTEGTVVRNDVVIASDSPDPDTLDNAAFDESTVQVPVPPDVGVTKTDSPDAGVIAGSNITYTITVTNTTTATTDAVTLTDNVPAGTTFVSMEQASGPAFAITRPSVGGTGPVSAVRSAGLGPNEVATFTMVVRVSPGTTAAINNTATVSTPGDANAGNNTDQESTTVQSRADVGVTKTDSPDPVSAGGTISYTITVTNAGPSNAANAQLSDVIPDNTTFVSMTQTSGPGFNIVRPAVGGGGTVTASVGSLAPGATATFTLVVQANSDIFGGTIISNTATVSTTSTDPNSGNDSATETTGVTVPPDFGDAPASYGTLQANDGPRHPVSSLRLGADVDFEPDGQPTAAADGDDLAGNDDEDGVIVPLGMIPGRAAAAIVTASATGRLDAWFDFNRNGTFEAGERIADSLIVAAGANTVFFDVPADAVVGDTYARFRISTAGGLGPTGAAVDGEVEDYATRIFTVNPGQVGIVPDPVNPGQNMLLIMGTASSETIAVTQLRTHRLRVQVNMSNRSRGQFPMANFRRIVVFAGAGNDTVNIGLARPALLHGEEGSDRLSGGGGFDELHGGPGNDGLSGGSGDDYLFGEDGNDSLNGGNGNDVLLGGSGRDAMNGGSGRDMSIGGLGIDTLGGAAGDDILIGGTTSHDENRAALAAIMAEWSSKAAFHPRVNGLGGLLNVGTVQDDASRDRLTGATERDWYLDYLLADSLVGFNGRQDRRN